MSFHRTRLIHARENAMNTITVRQMPFEFPDPPRGFPLPGT